MRRPVGENLKRTWSPDLKCLYINDSRGSCPISILCKSATWYPAVLYTWLLDIRSNGIQSETAHL